MWYTYSVQGKKDNDKEYNFIDLNYFPNLREIIIINFGINNFEFDILERCRKLKVIELIDCDITERGRREIQDDSERT